MLMNTCINQGIKVPQELSIMGFDDNQNGRLFRPALTTIHQDITEKGVIATKELIKMINGKVPKEHQIIMGTKLIERDSVLNLNKNEM
jgi:LacI family transcriptional regulator